MKLVATKKDLEIFRESLKDIISNCAITLDIEPIDESIYPEINEGLTTPSLNICRYGSVIAILPLEVMKDA